MSDLEPAHRSGLDEALLADERLRASSGAHRERRKRASQVVAAIVVVSAVAGAFAGARPTEIVPLDVLYQAGYAAALTAAATRAKRWTWFVAAGAAGAVGLGGAVAALCAVAALAVAYWSMRYGRRQREIGAVVGALVAQSLLRLPTDLAFAVPTVTACLAPLPLLVSALRNTRSPSRYLWPIAGVTAGLAVIGGLFVVAMTGIEADARDGLAAARDGLAAARSGDDPAASGAFADASLALDRAGDGANTWWLWPARAVPVLSQHLAAVDDITTEASALAALSLDQIAVLDIRGLGAPDGGFDLARVAELAPAATRVADALDSALVTVRGVDSPWLITPVTDRIDEFEAEIADVAPTARNAADGLRVAPSLLGVDGTKSYVVLVGNPAESRELGGFVAAIGVLTADQGRLRFDSSGSISGVNRLVAQSAVSLDGIDLPAPLPAGDPAGFAQNWANTVDFDAVAAVARALGPAATGGPVDGVLYLDPYALAALLSVTGPVPVDGLDRPLHADDAAAFFLREQYLVDSFESDGERKELLADAAEAAFARLFDDTLPDPRVVANALAPLVQARRLLFSVADPTVTPILERVGLSPVLDTGSPDQILVAQQNLRANKLDAYLSREITYDVDIDEAGNAQAQLTVELTNAAPLTGLPDYVTGDGDLVRPDDTLAATTDRISLDVHSVLDVVGVTIDGIDAGTGSSARNRLQRTSVRVDVPAQSTVRVVFSLSGTIDGPYALHVLPNATAAIDSFSGTVTVGGENRATARNVAIDRMIRIG